MARKYWLMKSEPDVYSIDDLASDGATYWDGVRNYQARNFLRDDMKGGDLVFFYHSNAEPPGIAGIAEVTREGYPDPSAFDRRDKHYDSDSKQDKPTWYVVEIKFKAKFEPLVSLEELKGLEGLEKMALLKKGQRLSVQPVTSAEWDRIVRFQKQRQGKGQAISH